jgi:hypothetical protein
LRGGQIAQQRNNTRVAGEIGFHGVSMVPGVHWRVEVPTGLPLRATGLLAHAIVVQ